MKPEHEFLTKSKTGLATYQNLRHNGNSDKHHTGKECIYCKKPAGTAWSPLLCTEHNIERMERIDRSLEKLLKRFDEKDNEN